MKWDRDAIEAPHTQRELTEADGGSLQKPQRTDDPTEINTDPAYVREFADTCDYTEREMILALLDKLEEAQAEVERHQSDRPFIIGANHGFDACMEQHGPPRWWCLCEECRRPKGQPHNDACPHGPGTVTKAQTFGGCR